MSNSKIGLIAGAGNMPVLWARAAKEKGVEISAIAITEEAGRGLEGIADRIHRFSVGQVGKIIRTLKDEGLREIVFIGKINKTLMFKDIKLDLKAIALLAGLKDRNDDTIMLGIVDELKRNGIEVVDQRIYLEDMLPAPGVLTKRKPNADEMADIAFGVVAAKGIAGLDIGQTVVIKKKAVVAVEAIEGTDEAIRRGGRIGEGNIVVVKVAKPFQDFRFDIPTIGLTTLLALEEAGGKTIAVEARKTFIADMPEVIREADRKGISLIAIDVPTPST